MATEINKVELSNAEKYVLVAIHTAKTITLKQSTRRRAIQAGTA